MMAAAMDPSKIDPSWMDASADISYKIILSTAWGFAIATTGIILRLVSRWLCRKRLETNDYLILAAYIPKLAIDVSSILLIDYGIGKHVLTVPKQHLVNYFKVFYIGDFIYALCITLIKLSILSLFWTAFPSKQMRFWIVVVGGVVTAWGIACVLVGIFSCLPIHKFWDRSVPGTCIDQNAFYYGLQIPTIITDFAILFLPMKPVWDLQLPTRQKVSMTAIFCLALVTCAFDIVRLVALVQTPASPDITWISVPTSIWTDIEPSVGILVACLAVCKPLLHPKRFWRMRSQARTEMDEEDDLTESESQKTKRGPSSSDSHELNGKSVEEGRRFS